MELVYQELDSLTIIFVGSIQNFQLAFDFDLNYIWISLQCSPKTIITLYSLKWENGLIMRGPASNLKSPGDHVCTYEKSKYCTEGKKSNFSIGHKF